jgi:hypothetical protein
MRWIYGTNFEESQHTGVASSRRGLEPHGKSRSGSECCRMSIGFRIPWIHPRYADQYIDQISTSHCPQPQRGLHRLGDRVLASWDTVDVSTVSGGVGCHAKPTEARSWIYPRPPFLFSSCAV